MTARPVRVLVVGPHPLARRRLRPQLEEAGCTLCAEARDPAEAVAAALREHPDVCVVDVADADDGLATVTAISCHTHASVVVLGPEPSDDDLLASLAAGASGYVRSGTHPSGVRSALRDLMAGGSAFPRRMDTLLVAALHDPPAGRRRPTRA
jgi:DNA-binding NarL/FixJ family response regulator